MCETSVATSELTLSECVSLLYIATTPTRTEVPDCHADKLMRLGLTEIFDGRFEYTDLGRQVAARTAMMGRMSAGTVH